MLEIFKKKKRLTDLTAIRISLLVHTAYLKLFLSETLFREEELTAERKMHEAYTLYPEDWKFGMSGGFSIIIITNTFWNLYFWHNQKIRRKECSFIFFLMC